MYTAKAPHTEPIPGYRLLEPLGKGGFGVVWKCQAPGGLFKAIKFVHLGDALDDPEGIGARREMRALQLLKSIRHPFLLSVERIEEIDGELLILMELAERSLHDLLVEYRAAGRLGIPRTELLGYMREASEAIDVLNQEHGLQHLDIKPRNLFLLGRHVKVADFGLMVSLGDRQSQSSWLRRGEALTPLYAAPESFLGRFSLFSDQYSLAITYQELLTNTLPFTGRNFGQVAMRHMQEPPDLQLVPEAERPILTRALAKEPDERYPSCRAFVEALTALGDVPTPCPVRSPGTPGGIRLPPAAFVAGQEGESGGGRVGSSQHGTKTQIATLSLSQLARAKRPARNGLAEVSWNQPVEEMKRLLAEQVVTAAADWDVRLRGFLRYRFHRGGSAEGISRAEGVLEAARPALEHRAFGELSPATMRLQLAGFEEQWNTHCAEVVSEYPTATWLYRVGLRGSLWQRCLGRSPGLFVRITLAAPPTIGETMSDIVLRLSPCDCPADKGADLLQTVGPELLQSLRDHLQLPPDCRGEERLPWRENVRVRPLPSDREVGEPFVARTRDLSSGGLGLDLPCRPSCEFLIVEMCPAHGAPLTVPVEVLHAHPRGEGRYHVGTRFAWELVRNH